MTIPPLGAPCPRDFIHGMALRVLTAVSYHPQEQNCFTTEDG